MHFIKYLIILFLSYSSVTSNHFNPYETLGVSRTASEREIRQAYKKLAKHWHPDKNSEPNASDQFTKINAAYQILSDQTKRYNYDQYGTTSQDQQHGFNTEHFHDPFDMFREHFFHEAPSGAKKVLHANEFLHHVLPNSAQKPYLIFGSTNFCFHCRRPMAIFRSMEKLFNDVGISTAEFNINEQRLNSELGILSNPSLCVISRGRVYHFNQIDFSEANIKEFVRKSIPIHRFIQTLKTSDDILTMISSLNQSNHVHAFLATRHKTPTLKFVLPCLQYSTRIQCVVFNPAVITTDLFPSALKQISPTSDTILLFKEDTSHPEIVLKDNDLTLNSIQNTFEFHQLLHLSTVTSSTVFNLVCPVNSVRPCFLIIGDPRLFAQYHSSFLSLSKQIFHEHKSRMAYLDTSSGKQVAFGKLLFTYYHQNERKLLILAARRWSADQIELQNTDIELDETSLKEFSRHVMDIEENLKLFLQTRGQKTRKYSLPVIIDFDERHENILVKLVDQFEMKWNYWIERNRVLRYLSGYLYTYQFWLFTLILFLYLYYARQEPSNKTKINPIGVQEFNDSLLQRYTTPGSSNVIIFVLIADTPKDPCVKDFLREINLMKDSRMVFSILYRSQSAQWLEKLSNQIEDSDENQQFPPATVLALYIRRKFFVSYGPLCEQISDDQSSMLTLTDWIDLLMNGDFRKAINISEWPIKFH